MSVEEERSTLVWTPCLFKDVVKVVCGTFLSYFDFLRLHSTCHTLWKPFEQHFYGEYLLKFLDGCEERNTAKALETSHSQYHRQIRIVRSVRTVHLLVNDLLGKMRKEPNLVGFHMDVGNIVLHLRHMCDVYDSDLNLACALTLDRFILHMENWYGWSLWFDINVINETHLLPFPTPLVNIERYELFVAPHGLRFAKDGEKDLRVALR